MEKKPAAVVLHSVCNTESDTPPYSSLIYLLILSSKVVFLKMIKSSKICNY